jgi:hypothetical protein
MHSSLLSFVDSPTRTGDTWRNVLCMVDVACMGSFPRKAQCPCLCVDKKKKGEATYANTIKSYR